jgi:hypothetical protein
VVAINLFGDALIEALDIRQNLLREGMTWRFWTCAVSVSIGGRRAAGRHQR